MTKQATLLATAIIIIMAVVSPALAGESSLYSYCTHNKGKYATITEDIEGKRYSYYGKIVECKYLVMMIVDDSDQYKRDGISASFVKFDNIRVIEFDAKRNGGGDE